MRIIHNARHQTARTQAHRLRRRYQNQDIQEVGVDKLIKAYEDYIKLLGEEIDELAVFASVHGWKSKRYELGVKMRAKIKKLRQAEPQRGADKHIQ